jgi:sphinganine-1-phosphate aldolase
MAGARVSEHLRTASWPTLIEHGVCALALLYTANKVRKYGLRGTLQKLLSGALHAVPGAKAQVENEIEKEAEKAVAELSKDNAKGDGVPTIRELPPRGVPRREVLRFLKAIAAADAHADEGKMFAYVYAWGGRDDEIEPREGAEGKSELGHYELLAKAANLFVHSNALNPTAFKSLRRFENEVVAMGLRLMRAPESGRGALTSGGTESIIMALKAHRDRARAERGIVEPNVVAAISVHPAFEKGAHMLGITMRHAPLDPTSFRVDVRAMEALVDSSTILLVGSAPQYAHGVIDPIPEIARLGLARGVPVHVDACVGGYLLPHIESAGFPVPPWDFRVQGVESISADLHKYGYTLKGASTLLFRSDAFRKYMFFAYADWPGGLFVSPGVLGTRGGSSIAAAWAALVSLGREGYEMKARQVMETARFLQKAIAAIPELQLCGQPEATILAFRAASPQLNIFAVADVMEQDFGWKMERQPHPDSIHMTLMPVHSHTRERLVADLLVAVDKVKRNPELSKSGTAAMYGMVAKIPSNEVLEEFLTAFMRKIYS